MISSVVIHVRSFRKWFVCLIKNRCSNFKIAMIRSVGVKWYSHCSIELETMRLQIAIIIPFCCVLKHFAVYVINCTLAKGEKQISFFLSDSVAPYSPQTFNSFFIGKNFFHLRNVQINEKCIERKATKLHFTN